MKIAIVAPKPVPYAYWGAQKLYDQMLESINKYSKHKCELVAIDSKEHNFWDLIHTYNSFFNADLRKYDLVISTKYPSWMIKCETHFTFLQHCLRGLYDTYHFTKLPEKTETDREEIKEILKIVRSKDYKRERFTEVYNKILENEKLIRKERLDVFPGPFIREIIHFFDKIGLSSCQKFFTQSYAVKNRKDHFPENVNVKVIYPPIIDKGYECKSYEDFVFAASRLEHPKRIDLIIEAFKQINEPKIKLKIAGTGPELGKLKKIAGNDKRINFLGFVDKKELIDNYSRCLFVPFIPYDEDYGFVTMEAMKSSKAVLTCSDSGGPFELVKDNITGKIAKPEVDDIKKKMEFMIKNKKKTIEMGINGCELVKDITFEKFVKELELDTVEEIKEKENELIVLNTFSLIPPKGGGQVRLYNLYNKLSEHIKIKFFNLVDNYFKESTNQISSNIVEYNIHPSEEHSEEVLKLERKARECLHDVAMISFAHLSKGYKELVRKHCGKNKILVCSHPYMYNIAKNLPHKYIIYEALNVEYELKKQIFKENKAVEELLDKLFQTEKELCKKAKYILTTSDEEKNLFNKLYGVNKNKMINIPNGVDCDKIKFVGERERRRVKDRLGLSDKRICLFLGSWHKPNLDSLLYIVKLAKVNKDTTFFVLGTVCDYYNHSIKKKVPENVVLFGAVDDFQKEILTKVSDFAINPMFMGAGTNLKIFEYMAAGLPVITTNLGIRGLDEEKIDVYLITEKIEQIDVNRLEKLNLKKNRIYVEVFFDWKVISEKYKRVIQTNKGNPNELSLFSAYFASEKNELGIS